MAEFIIRSVPCAEEFFVQEQIVGFTEYTDCCSSVQSSSTLCGLVSSYDFLIVKLTISRNNSRYLHLSYVCMICLLAIGITSAF